MKRPTERRYLAQESDLVQRAKAAEKEWKEKRRFSGLQEFRDLLKELGLIQEYTKCCICGWSKTTVDLAHIIPFTDGGDYELKNIVPLCPNHHRCTDYGLLNENEKRKIEGFVEKILFLAEPI